MHLACGVPTPQHCQGGTCPGGGGELRAGCAPIIPPGGSFLPVLTPFQLQEASQGWPFCLLIRQTELLHLKIRLHHRVKEIDASSPVKPPLVSPLPALISMCLVSTRLPLSPAPELLEGRNCISLTVVSTAPLTTPTPVRGEE